MKTFNTKKSLYPAVEIEIDDKIYQSLKLTHSVLVDFVEIEKEIQDPDKVREATLKWVSRMFKVEKAILEKLEVREVDDIFIYASGEFRKVEMGRLDNAVADAETDMQKLKKVEEVTKKIPSSKNSKRSGDKT